MMEVVKLFPADISILTDLTVIITDSEENRGLQSSLESLQKICAADNSYLFAAIADGITAGYALAYTFPYVYDNFLLAYLYDIEVVERHRRKGIGKLLISAVCDTLKAAGVKELWLGTAVDNTEGQALFSSTGAVQSEETFNDYTYYLDASG